MKMKIVFITDSLSYGGAEKMLTFVLNSCASIFDEVLLISLYNINVIYDLDDRVDLVCLGCAFSQNNQKGLLNKIINRFEAVVKLRKILLKINPDLICSFGINNILLSFLASLALDIKIVGSERRSPENLTFLWRQISKFVYQYCDGLVFQLEEAKNFYGHKVQEGSIVIPNPYLGYRDYIPCPANLRQKTITAAAARFEYAKGFDSLIKAFDLIRKSHQDMKLIIYGEGDTKLLYGELINILQLKEYVQFPGLVKDVASEVYSSSVFVLPSRYEGIPNTLLEVMGAGVPTVSYNCPPGGPKLLTNGGNRGLLVPVDDYEALALAICKVIDDENFSNCLSNKSLEVRKEFRPDAISRKWITYLKSILT